METFNKDRVKIIVICSIGILYIILFVKFNIGIPCIFHEITGLYCPGCGSTRAAGALIKLEFYQAFRYNALATILLPFSFFYLILQKKIKIPNIVWYALLAITIIFGILRNIEIFSFLAPTNIT